MYRLGREVELVTCVNDWNVQVLVVCKSIIIVFMVVVMEGMGNLVEVKLFLFI